MQLSMNQSSQLVCHLIGAFAMGLFLSACATSAISPKASSLQAPDAFVHQPKLSTGKEESDEQMGQPSDRWLAEFGDQQLNEVVISALVSNYGLAEQAARLEEAQQGVVIAGADRYPSLSVSSNNSIRRGALLGRIQSTIDTYGVDLNASWELDIWGRLKSNQKQATMSYAASEASYISQRLALVSDTSRAWYQMMADQQLLALFNLRLATLEQDMAIISSGYRAGLNSALDVYLASNSLEQERARVAQQEQNVIESVSRLQLLVADYPDGGWPLSRELPVIETSIPVGIPSDLLTRRPDVQQTWFNLLSADLSLAVAHKQRFPRLTLNASMSDDANNVSDLLTNGSLARSLITNIALPLFQGGRLVATEEQARQRVIQLEQQYLNAVNNAFSDVERAITRQDRLRRRYDSFLKAEQNAIAAYELSFEQYQSGLSEYQTVLESQRRAFDSQNTVIDLRNQLLQNRITLYQSLGGDFGADIIEHASSFENSTSTENVTSEEISEQVITEPVILVRADK